MSCGKIICLNFSKIYSHICLVETNKIDLNEYEYIGFYDLTKAFDSHHYNQFLTFSDMVKMVINGGEHVINWEEGKLIVFDDSFEHEVSKYSKSSKIMFIKV